MKGIIYTRNIMEYRRYCAFSLETLFIPNGENGYKSESLWQNVSQKCRDRQLNILTVSDLFPVMPGQAGIATSGDTVAVPTHGRSAILVGVRPAHSIDERLFVLSFRNHPLRLCSPVFERSGFEPDLCASNSFPSLRAFLSHTTGGDAPSGCSHHAAAQWAITPVTFELA